MIDAHVNNYHTTSISVYPANLHCTVFGLPNILAHEHGQMNVSRRAIERLTEKIVRSIDVINVFTFFYSGHVIYALTFFLNFFHVF